jgi:hypothetical protein
MEVSVLLLLESLTFAQNHLIERNALHPVNNRILDPDASKCSSDIGVGHRHPEVAIYLVDEPGTASIIFEGQLILTASFQNAKQSQIENLEDLHDMRLRCESNHNHARTGSREKLDDNRSDVRLTIIHQQHSVFFA